jgi:hypothetical protein
MTEAKDPYRKEKPMFAYTNPEYQLNLAHERAAEFQRQATARRLGRRVSARSHARSGRRARAAHHT